MTLRNWRVVAHPRVRHDLVFLSVVASLALTHPSDHFHSQNCQRESRFPLYLPGGHRLRPHHEALAILLQQVLDLHVHALPPAA